MRSHGLHYFLHSIWPLVQQRNITNSEVSISENVVSSLGQGGIGFGNTIRCLRRASEIAEGKGNSLVIFKNPGKVGALRIYCQEFMDKGQLIILLKNTAATVGLLGSNKPLIGTNPICIGLPDSKFIYDSSTSTIATNKLRVHEKTNTMFDCPVGVDRAGHLTKDPKEVLEEGGYLLPFSYQDYAFKGFFMGVIIECMAAMAGGKTSIRVGKHKGPRLYSDEGMIGILIDKKIFPQYSNYLEEMPQLFADLAKVNVRLPNSTSQVNGEVSVLRQDWEALATL